MSPAPAAKPAYHIPIVDFLNNLVGRISEAAAWLNTLLIGVIVAQVIMRYGFNNGQVVLEELMWHLYAVAFMFGLAYSVTKDSHIRVDLVHMNLPRRAQHVIEILGITLLLMPVLWILFDHSLGWVADSFRVDEGSTSPQGLGNRWLIKSVIPVTCILIFTAALARLIQEITFLIHHDKEPEELHSGRVSMLRSFFRLQPSGHGQETDEHAEGI
jgi:TRAP-type mannitol/chloroaromatic compound transport system permease small subunit